MSAAPPLISVITPAYNAERFIAATIESVQRQTYSHLEHIIVDDGSRDGTAAIVERYAAEDARIRLVRQANAGNPTARNNGFAVARGAFVAPLDADDVWAPEKLARQQAVFARSGPELVLVYCWSRYVDVAGVPIGGYVAHALAGSLAPAMLCFNFVGNGSVPLIRRSALAEAGGYSLDVPGLEDQDLFFRLALLGTFDVAPEVLLDYRQVPGSQSRKVRQISASYEALVARARRLCPGLPARVFRWSRGVFESYVGTRALQEGNWPVLLGAVGRAGLADPWALTRIGASAFGKLLGGRDVPGGPVRPSPSPLGFPAARRLADMAGIAAQMPAGRGRGLSAPVD